MLIIIFLILAAVFFALAAFRIPARLDFIALGLFALTLAFLIPELR